MFRQETISPFNIVLFGGNGDLAMRKLLPALFRLYTHKLLNLSGYIICASRTELDHDSYKFLVHANLSRYLDDGELTDTAWHEFSQILKFACVEVEDIHSFAKLQDLISESPASSNVFYFSTPPDLFGTICSQLDQINLIDLDSRIVLEKPIGEDLVSSKVINTEVARYFREEQIYRIDHYLGKETVQNLLSVRFANILFEPLWNSHGIDHVQITVAETVGTQGRAAYYDRAGALRDMVQNHLLQLLCLVAMEPPGSLNAADVRDEKLRVLKSLKPITSKDVVKKTIRGQYQRGIVKGMQVRGYLEESGVATQSTETFVAVKAEIDNWRWQGVPFYLRTGKRMPFRYSEIVIQFKEVPHSIFNDGSGNIGPNKLIIRLQPEESIQLVMMNKVPGLDESMKLRAVPLNLSLTKAFDSPRTPAAYERLFLDVFRLNQALFTSRDEIEAAWSWIDQIRKGWQETGELPKPYAAGTWGPREAARLMDEEGGQSWHN